jgi:D-arabinose 1-dehydrogenase-like Zn-dependent alcohol dehydrogenase
VSPLDLLELGEAPDLGVVPRRMLAQVIRAERFGEPADAFREEAIEIPELGPRDVLVYVMAAGVNYNNVWAAMGIPIDVIKTRQKKGEREDFHIGGSDASGVVWAVGKDVTNVRVGDEVVIHCELVTAGQVDPCLSRVFPFAGTAGCHQLMRDNQHPSGNMAILVNAPRPGLRTLADGRAAR